jgi:hypothetical protein
MGRAKVSEEQRRKTHNMAAARYRIKKGQIPGAVGRPKENIEKTEEVIGGAIVITQKPKPIPISKMPSLPDHPTLDDMKRFVIEMARNAAEVGSAPAMIAAAQTLQKEIDRWEKSNPPQVEPPKPRPRIPVEIEITKIKCPHCGKEFEV